MQTPSKNYKKRAPVDTKESLLKEISLLESQLAASSATLGLLAQRVGDNDPHSTVSTYISQMHKYNETKDAAQIVFGRLAVLNNTTLKDIHSQYSVDSED
ncbi:hypothetical protein BB561_004121 [Smittium simulii]|uniref:Swi5-domain-containing protein n=1 Tax=Smittium simulii TaxID=133385 RepID=A0A2T9YHX1_9FUNG|nr:hypothetical protein BB561_004121 [Smittium simulii]